MPKFLEIVCIALGLAMDAFAVSIAASVALKRCTPRQVFRLSFHFGLFQALMPVIGWLIGRGFYKYIAPFDHWVAFALLAFIGAKMLLESFQPADEPKPDCDPTKGASLVLLSIGTSIDALAAGLAFSVLAGGIWLPALVIGLITAALVVVGMRIGARLGLALGHYVEITGGIVLIGIGVKILIDHIWFNAGAAPPIATGL
ncbi:manganese efflux pump [bacterium]|nr:manganese efflux pump [bacterium]